MARAVLYMKGAMRRSEPGTSDPGKALLRKHEMLRAERVQAFFVFSSFAALRLRKRRVFVIKKNHADERNWKLKPETGG